MVIKKFGYTAGPSYRRSIYWTVGRIFFTIITTIYNIVTTKAGYFYYYYYYYQNGYYYYYQGRIFNFCTNTTIITRIFIINSTTSITDIIIYKCILTSTIVTMLTIITIISAVLNLLWGHPFMGEGVRLRWTHVDGGGGSSQMWTSTQKIKIRVHWRHTVFFSCKEVGVFFTRISSLDRKKWKFFCNID